ncbi:DUF4041 domain-containing protein [Acinetobacter bouvetii]|uniref:SNIPE associated domain-containing protein n=1 Tax=Acinetobacter bouvetii TaxID=202951 RepID=A0A811G9K5_9GAMM|nr:DUF4041 domain-containing protein [Acinetobacter bouvetii]CAB1209835.1 hypothetical protein SFB21_0629 [Acinetobacter bouvetii]
MIYFFIITIVIVLALVYGVIRLLKEKKNNIVSLQANLDRTRTNLAEHELQNDELHHALNTHRIELGNLRNKVEKLDKYQPVLDIENYVADRKIQVESFVEATKIEAEFLLQEMTAKIEKLRLYLDTFEKNTKQRIEANAREHLKGFYNQAVEQENLTAISKALENKIHGYGTQYLYPAQTLLEEFIEGYEEVDSALYLTEIRRKITHAIQANDTAECDYVEENRRQSAIDLVTHVFNSKADLYLSQLRQDNLGQMIQSLKDDFVLINHYGAAFSHARIKESFLALRSEEFKFATLLLNFKVNKQAGQTQLRAQMVQG